MMEEKIIRTWVSAHPKCRAGKTRPKKFQILMSNGRKIFRKEDSSELAIKNEVEILGLLGDCERVPKLIKRTPVALSTRYIDGDLLDEVANKLNCFDCFNISLQIIGIVGEIHGRGIVHGDIRLWNFICDTEKRIFLFDFEYSYIVGKKYSRQTLEYFNKHHRLYLRTAAEEWCDVFKCIWCLWLESKSWPLCIFFSQTALFVYLISFFRKNVCSFVDVLNTATRKYSAGKLVK